MLNWSSLTTPCISGDFFSFVYDMCCDVLSFILTQLLNQIDSRVLNQLLNKIVMLNQKLDQINILNQLVLQGDNTGSTGGFNPYTESNAPSRYSESTFESNRYTKLREAPSRYAD